MFALMGVTGQVGGAVADNLLSKNPHRPPLLAPEAVRDAGRSGGYGGLCVQPMGLGHQRVGAAGGRRRGPVHRVNYQRFPHWKYR